MITHFGALLYAVLSARGNARCPSPVLHAFQASYCGFAWLLRCENAQFGCKARAMALSGQAAGLVHFTKSLPTPTKLLSKIHTSGITSVSFSLLSLWGRGKPANKAFGAGQNLIPPSWQCDSHASWLPLNVVTAREAKKAKTICKGPKSWNRRKRGRRLAWQQRRQHKTTGATCSSRQRAVTVQQVAASKFTAGNCGACLHRHACKTTIFSATCKPAKTQHAVKKMHVPTS